MTLRIISRMTARIKQQLGVQSPRFSVHSTRISTTELWITNIQWLCHHFIIIKMHHLKPASRILSTTSTTSSRHNRVTIFAIRIGIAMVTLLSVSMSICTHNLFMSQILWWIPILHKLRDQILSDSYSFKTWQQPTHQQFESIAMTLKWITVSNHIQTDFHWLSHPLSSHTNWYQKWDESISKMFVESSWNFLYFE